MKTNLKTIISISSIFLSMSVLYGQNIETKTIIGEKEIGKREIIIYTPKEYIDPTAKFEVVYVLDAQQREFFDVVHSTIAFQNYGLRPMIVVGIVSENRNKDFLPENKHPETFQELAGELGNASNFSDFIDKTLFKYINMNYRTLPTNIGIGYSNGGTFINYVMLTKPNMFDVIFSIDANMNYDRGQMIDRIENNQEFKQSKIFYYSAFTATSENWIKSSEKFNEILVKNKNITFENDFFQNESHSTVFQQGVINAFKAYFRYQFFNSSKLIEYFKNLENEGHYALTRKELHRIAKFYMQYNLTEDAREVLINFQEKLSGEIEDSDDLYDLFGTGDLYLNLNFKDKAKEYFLFCESKLEKNKNKISKDFYDFGKGKIKEKLELIDKNDQ